MEQNTSFIVQFKCGAREEEQTIRKKNNKCVHTSEAM